MHYRLQLERIADHHHDTNEQTYNPQIITKKNIHIPSASRLLSLLLARCPMALHSQPQISGTEWYLVRERTAVSQAPALPVEGKQERENELINKTLDRNKISSIDLI